MSNPTVADAMVRIQEIHRAVEAMEKLLELGMVWTNFGSNIRADLAVVMSLLPEE